jgi:Ser/Thr protein kinase RdoA (MazF antagonist)
MTGPAVQDLWMLLSGQTEEMRVQLDDIVAGYQNSRISITTRPC